MITVNIEQRTDAWYDVRKGRITGSRFYRLMMGEKTKGYTTLIGELVSEIITGEIEDGFKSEIMENGTEMEPEAREVISDVVGEIMEVGFQMPEADNPYHDFVGFSPDGIIVETGIHVEIKCPLSKTHLSYFENMDDYRWQLQGGLWINKNEYSIFGSYFPKTKPLILRIEANEKDQKLIDERMKITYERVQELKRKYDQYDPYK